MFRLGRKSYWTQNIDGYKAIKLSGDKHCLIRKLASDLYVCSGV